MGECIRRRSLEGWRCWCCFYTVVLSFCLKEREGHQCRLDLFVSILHTYNTRVSIISFCGSSMSFICFIALHLIYLYLATLLTYVLYKSLHATRNKSRELSRHAGSKEMQMAKCFSLHAESVNHDALRLVLQNYLEYRFVQPYNRHQLGVPSYCNLPAPSNSFVPYVS